MAPPSKRAEAEDLFARVRAGEWVNDYETVRLRKDGTLVAVSIAAAPVRDTSGRVLGNMVAYTDITERKAQEAEVYRLNDELHARVRELAASRARIVTAVDVELARGLHPAILTDRGLRAAVEMLAARAPIPVEIAERYPTSDCRNPLNEVISPPAAGTAVRAEIPHR